MNNADMPIAALQTEYGVLKQTQDGVDYCGLTKREHFAGLAMQALVSNQQWMLAATDDLVVDACIEVAMAATKIADRLLAELETTNDK